MNETGKITVVDQDTGKNIYVENPIIYQPAIPKQDISYQENSILTCDGQPETFTVSYPSKPIEDYQVSMWETLDRFERDAWSPTNLGIKTGYDCIDKAFEGGLTPGFTIVGGDSNLGKTAFMTNLALNVVMNNQNIYVMDFSLDDSIRDKLSRVAACCGNITINAVKTPQHYKNNPYVLARRTQTMANLRTITDKYCAYDASFSTFVEDIQQEILNKLIYFDQNKIDKKLIVFIDNFHDMDIKEQPGLSMKDKFDTLAQWCSDFSTQQNIILVCSAELKKLNGTRRPQLDDLREAVKIKYAAKAVLLVYNEVHYKGESANVYFNEQGYPFKKPVFEVHFAKNKYGTYKGRNFFYFYPDTCKLIECDQQTSKTYTSIVYG